MRRGAAIIPAMDEPTTETKREILKLVFPDLQYGGDPGIERYFELRRERRLAQALAVYNGALRVRYPDDAARVQLLKLYRESDPRYAPYQEILVLAFASRLCARIRSNLDLITAPLERADLSDALRALKAVESVLARLPGETDAALALLERYDRFAQVLGHREAPARRALDLVREYDAVSRADSPAEYDFIARSAAIEERRRSAARARVGGAAEKGVDFVSRSASLEQRRRSAERARPSYFDPVRIKFSEADRARVEISPAISRREDKVLALCAKYWSLSSDPAFERIVFLYSRKFGGRHFEVFRVIKLGRGRGSTDDEILSAVASILTTSYNYSVSGDLYMQVMWRRLAAHGRADGRRATGGPRAPPRPHGPDRRPRRSLRVRAKRAQAAAEPPRALPIRGRSRSPAARRGTGPARRLASRRPPGAPRPRSRRTLGTAVTDEPPLSSGSARARRGEADDRRPRGAELCSGRAGQTPRSSPTAPAGGIARASARDDRGRAGREGGPLLTPAPKARAGRLLGRAPSGPEPLREIRAKRGSISDSIRKLSGKTYDVYKELFWRKCATISIARSWRRTTSHGIFVYDGQRCGGPHLWLHRRPLRRSLHGLGALRRARGGRGAGLLHAEPRSDHRGLLQEAVAREVTKVTEYRRVRSSRPSRRAKRVAPALILCLALAPAAAWAQRSAFASQMDGFTKSLVAQLSAKTAKGSAIAIADFDNVDAAVGDPNLGYAVSEIVTQDFQKSGDFIVLEKKQLQQILKTMELQLSGLYDSDKAVAIGSS